MAFVGLYVRFCLADSLFVYLLLLLLKLLVHLAAHRSVSVRAVLELVFGILLKWPWQLSMSLCHHLIYIFLTNKYASQQATPEIICCLFLQLNLSLRQQKQQQQMLHQHINSHAAFISTQPCGMPCRCSWLILH